MWILVFVCQSLDHLAGKMLYFFGLQLDEEPFNPDYVEVDRVLDMSTGLDQNSGEVRKVTLNLHSLYRK